MASPSSHSLEVRTNTPVFWGPGQYLVVDKIISGVCACVLITILTFLRMNVCIPAHYFIDLYAHQGWKNDWDIKVFINDEAKAQKGEK